MLIKATKKIGKSKKSKVSGRLNTLKKFIGIKKKSITQINYKRKIKERKNLILEYKKRLKDQAKRIEKFEKKRNETIKKLRGLVALRKRKEEQLKTLMNKIQEKYYDGKDFKNSINIKKITFEKASSAKYFNKDGTIKNEFKKYVKDKIENSPDFFKPIGLWYGFNDSWYNWCYEDMPSYISSMNVHKLNIPTNLNILKIKTIKDLSDFHNEYSINYISKDRDSNNIIPELTIQHIDWVKVKKNYDGIEFNPYMRKYRNKYDWYETVDASSGCIWNLENITSEYLGKLPKINKNNEENDLKKNKLKFKKLIS